MMKLCAALAATADAAVAASLRVQSHGPSTESKWLLQRVGLDETVGGAAPRSPLLPGANICLTAMDGQQVCPSVVSVLVSTLSVSACQGCLFLCVYVSMCLPACLSVCVCVCLLSVCLSVCLPRSVSVCLSWLSVCPVCPVCMSACLRVYMCACLRIC